MATANARRARPAFELLVTYLRPHWPQVVLLAVLLLGGTAVQLINPQLVRFFIDTAQAGGALPVLALAAALFLGMAVLTQVASVAETYVAGNLGWVATNALRGDLTRHCLELDLSFHQARTPGELIERVDGDVSILANFFSRFVLVILGSVLLLVGVLALLFREDWRLGLLFTLLSLAGLALTIFVRGITARYAAAQRQASAALAGFVEERLSALPDIQANGMQGHTVYRLHLALRELFQRARAAVMMGSLMGYVTGLVALAASTVTFAFGAYLVGRGEMSIGTVYLLFQYTAMLGRPLHAISRQLYDFQEAGAGVQRVRQLFDFPILIRDQGEATLPAGPLAVELTGVSFAYPLLGARLPLHGGGRAPTGNGLPAAVQASPSAAGAPDAVLHDVTFRVAPGRVLGLLGRTGSGKSTITRLLCRLYDPDRGSVRLGGVDLRRLRLEELRREVGVVTQEVQLFQASVRDNVALFDPQVPDAAIERALVDVGLGPWYGELPAGLDTPLGAGGSGLSAGQAQLLAFARVFLRDPRVVVLDEASSRLDPATERRIEAAVTRLLGGQRGGAEDGAPTPGGRTAIVIAHRLETVQRADDILILQDGRVVESGPRAALAADPGSRFAALLRLGLPEVLA
ncbi:MAG TPA: ABC transporter ATP-binding protein [Chloroflexota bacterium]|nr:ABC transporter ATP-binding protein [Chloroflexota bacterium]